MDFQTAAKLILEYFSLFQVLLPLGEPRCRQHCPRVQAQPAGAHWIKDAQQCAAVHDEVHLLQEGETNFKGSVPKNNVLMPFFLFQSQKKLKAAGFGCYTTEEVDDMGKKDLKVLSELLGDKQVRKTCQLICLRFFFKLHSELI